MDIPQETEDYIRESIEYSVGLPISEKTLRLKLLASEEDRHLLQDQNFILHDQLKELHKRFKSCKEEASMNAQGLRKCIQEKETLVAKYADMEKYCAKLKREHMLFERDLEKTVEACDELEKENNELRDQLQDTSPSLQAISAEVKSLQEDKKNILKNLQRAEEEVKVLFEDNKLLKELHKQLLRQLQKEKECHGSDYKHSASGSSARGKRKSRFREDNTYAREADINVQEHSRQQPFSPM